MSQTVEGFISEMEDSVRRVRRARELFPDIQLVDGRLWSDMAKEKANSIEVWNDAIVPAYREDNLVVLVGRYGWIGPITAYGLLDGLRKNRPEVFRGVLKFLLESR